MREYTGYIRLGMGHSLITGHGPLLHDLEAIKADDRARISSFGLFNIATPDTKSYYKDVKPEDLTPKAEDYIKPLFRGLSEVIVRKAFDPIDFGHNKGVLKESTPLLLSQSIFTNHEAAVGNEVGVVSNTFWDGGYTSENGQGIFNIPAGVNFEAMIDGKIHTKLVRDLQSDPPTVHSNSVTVQFKWEQSHPTMKYEDFRARVGTFDDKKQLIRRVATKIDAYHETSLVAHGADPYAQMIKDGKIVNPRYASHRDSFSEGAASGKEVKYYYFSDFKTSLSEETIPDESNIIENEENSENKNPIKMKKSVILLMAMLAGLTLTAEQQAIPEADFAEKFDFDAFGTQLEGKVTVLEELKTFKTVKDELDSTKIKLTTAEKFKTDNEPFLQEAAVVTALKATQLAELIRISTLVNGKAPDDTLKATYNAADLKTLNAFLTPLQSQLESKFPMTCKACGSKEVNRATAKAGDMEDEKKPKTTNDTRDSLRAKFKTGVNSSFLSEPEKEIKK